jgi:lipopolysaccharide export system protein LptA
MKSTDEETRAICTGNVVLTGTNLKITCDRLEIIATRIGDKDETIGTFEHFKYILATGHVRIVQGDREATCGRAEVFPRDEKVVLTEAPVLLDHSNNTLLAATRITLLRGQREAIAEDVRLMAPPIQDLGANAKPEKK